MGGDEHGGPPDGSGTTVRMGRDGDAQVAADLHVVQISEGFLSLLGRGFLRRLYRRIVRSSSAFLLVAERQGQVVGFVAGAVDTGALYREFVLRDGIRAGLGAAGPIFRNWRQVVETLRHGTSQGVSHGRGVELLSIAVDPDRQGQGIGRLLVDSFVDACTTTGNDSASVVVSSDNSTAIRLYEQAGFVAATRFEMHADVESVLMERSGSGHVHQRPPT
jgi:ribosomal protein S18 acetylase RimI-like enzyme